MDAKNLAKYYFENTSSYREARSKALINIVNRNDIYRPSNKFIETFWTELKKHYPS